MFFLVQWPIVWKNRFRNPFAELFDKNRFTLAQNMESAFIIWSSIVVLVVAPASTSSCTYFATPPVKAYNASRSSAVAGVVFRKNIFPGQLGKRTHGHKARLPVIQRLFLILEYLCHHGINRTTDNQVNTGLRAV